MIVKLNISWASLAMLRPVEVIAGLPSFFSLGKTPYKCIWALHCAMENGNLFFDRLDCAALIEKYKIAIIAPTLGNGFFINSDFEAQADFLDELAAQLPQLLPLSIKKEDNSVIGVSMGGFGALRWALESGRFSTAAAISGVFDCHVEEDQKIYKDRNLKALQLTFKKIMARFLLNPDGTTKDRVNFAKLGKEIIKETDIRLICGEQDYISLNQTTWLKELLSSRSFPVTMRLIPGSHDVECWEKAFRILVDAICHRYERDAKN